MNKIIKILHYSNEKYNRLDQHMIKLATIFWYYLHFLFDIQWKCNDS